MIRTVSCLGFHATSRSAVWTDVRRSRRTMIDPFVAFLDSIRTEQKIAQFRLSPCPSKNRPVQAVPFPPKHTVISCRTRCHSRDRRLC